MSERTKRPIPLNQIEGVSAGSTATITLPRNFRYHGLCLQYDTTTAGGATEANMETEITEIRIILDDVVQRVCSAAQLFDINRSKGQSPTVGDGTLHGFMPIHFSEPQRESKIEREVTAWGMKDVGSFKIEVDIANNSAQTPTLKGFAVVDKVMEAPKGIVKWKRNTLTIGGTGPNEFNLVSLKGDSIQALHFFEGTDGDIGDLLVEWDGEKMYDLDEMQDKALFSHFVDGYDEVTKKPMVPFDFNHPEDALRAFRTRQDGQQYRVQEVLATLDMDQAANVTLIAEMVGLPD